MFPAQDLSSARWPCRGVRHARGEPRSRVPSRGSRC